MLTANSSADGHKYLNDKETSVLKYLHIANIHNRTPPALSPLEMCAIVEPFGSHESPVCLHAVSDAVFVVISTSLSAHCLSEV